MAERSMFWTTGTTGDGTATYTEAQLGEWLRDLFTPNSVMGNPHASEGVLPRAGGELAVTGASSPVSVASGAAIGEGFFYRSDAAVNVAIPTPASNTRIDRIVLRVSHGTTRTVRITRIAGTEGAGAPSLTQTAGTTWDIPLAQASITTGGVITLTDQRSFCHFATKVSQAMVENNAIGDAQLRDSAALSVVGRSANSTGDPADIAAGSDGHILRRSGTTLGFGQAATAGIADDAVDDTKAGNRVPQFYRRQGGSASVWATAGVTNQTPAAVRMQAGVVAIAGSSVTITFPVAFSQPPIVLTSPLTTGNTSLAFSVSATQATILTYAAGGSSISNGDVAWLAIGPE